MKRVLTAILALIIIYNSAGFILSFYSIQKSIKKDIRETIKRRLPLSQLELIKIPVQCINSKIEDDEFRFNGRLFDIVKEYKANDTVYYYCINDKTEEILFEKFSDQVSGNLGTEGIIKAKLIKNLKIFTFDAVTLLLKMSKQFYQKFTYPEYILQNYFSFAPEINPPPPRTVVG